MEFNFFKLQGDVMIWQRIKNTNDISVWFLWRSVFVVIEMRQRFSRSVNRNEEISLSDSTHVILRNYKKY